MMKMKKRILSILIIALLLSCNMPVDTVYAKEKGRLVLIQNEDLSFTAYEDLVLLSPKGNLMVKISSLSKKLGLTYKRINSGDFQVSYNDQILEFNKSSKTYTYKTKDASTYVEAAHNPYTTIKTAKENAVNVIHYSTLKNLVYTKYYNKSQSGGYKDIGYNGVIVYSPYQKIRSLPDLNTVNMSSKENFSDIHTKAMMKYYSRRIAVAKFDSIIGVKSDGTVIAAGLNNAGENNVTNWNDIVAVAAGNQHNIGLKSDGKIVAVGDNTYGQLNVSKWRDIVEVAAGYYHTVGLKSDGTVVAVGDNSEGQLNVSKWKDIVAIAAGAKHTVGIKSDGTVVAVGYNRDGQLNVSKWKDIVSVSAGYYHTVGLKSNGRVVAAGYDKYDYELDELSQWRDIVLISSSDFAIVGLRSDGTVIETGNWKISHWRDLIAIAYGGGNIVGIKTDGTVIAVGYSLPDLSEWNLK